MPRGNLLSSNERLQERETVLGDKANILFCLESLKHAKPVRQHPTWSHPSLSLDLQGKSPKWKGNSSGSITESSDKASCQPHHHCKWPFAQNKLVLSEKGENVFSDLDGSALFIGSIHTFAQWQHLEWGCPASHNWNKDISCACSSGAAPAAAKNFYFNQGRKQRILGLWMRNLILQKNGWQTWGSFGPKREKNTISGNLLGS